MRITTKQAPVASTSVAAGTRPTILQIIPRLDGGGAERTVVEVSEAIVAAGWRALVLAEPGRLSAEVARVGGETIDFPAAAKNPVAIWRNARAIADIVQRENVSLIHARSRAPAWSAFRAARLADVPFVTTYHGAYGETNAAKKLYNSVMARGDLVIANSAYTADLVHSRHRTPREKLIVINRGVDLRVFDPDKIPLSRQSALRESWQVTADQPVVLLAARLTAWKGQMDLIEAFAVLKKQDKLGNAVAILAGDAQGRDGYVETLDQAIAANGLAHHVKRVGHVTDIAAAYAVAIVTVVASTKPEAFGRSAAEAQALGCPVIATRLGAPQETVLAPPLVNAADRTGWLVEPSTPIALAGAIADVFALTPAERADLARRSRKNVADNYSLVGLQQQTLDVYRRLLRIDTR